MDKRITVETMATRSKRDIETKIQWLGPGQRKQQLNQAKKKLTIIERRGREKSDVLNSKILVKQGSMIMTVQNSLLETMLPDNYKRPVQLCGSSMRILVFHTLIIVEHVIIIKNYL